MLACGRNWQPQLVERVVRTFPTSTRVAHVVTDRGPAYLKGMGNPAGNGALTSEVLAGELACLIGVRVPDFAILQLDLDVPMQDHGTMQHGPAFASRAIKGMVADGTRHVLEKLIDTGCISRLVVFDTWIRNFDRHPPEGAWGEANRDNLFFKPSGRRFELVALDHSHCFVEGELDVEIVDPGVAEDDRIFGLFPEFEPFIEERAVLAAADALMRIDHGTLRAVLASIPQSWGLSNGARDGLVNVLLARASMVARIAPARLLAQQGLGV